MGRPTLLLLTAAVASVAAVGNAVALSAGDPQASPPQSRLGAQIAGDIGQRDRNAVQRGRALDMREQAVRAMEARLKPPAADPSATSATSAANAAAAAAPVPNQFDDLARIYQAMKPAAAAIVLEQLDVEVQMRVAQRMRERSTAQIMSAMTPKGAAALTMALARRAPPPRPMSAAARR